MTNLTTRSDVFFDLDGTLHQQNMFGSFLRYLLAHLPLNIMLVIPVLPLVAFGLLVRGFSVRWPISLLLWSITFGHKEARLQALQVEFVAAFRQRIRRFPQVLARLEEYLARQDIQVWLITGSPESLVQKVYHDAAFLPKVRLIGSRILRCYGGWVLTLRCVGYAKVSQLEYELRIPLKLYSGYSDSVNDNPLLYYCKYRWRVTRNGQLKLLD
ncbi:phosphatidylglycerophosphatase C [Sodalis endosymbiont of Henestaris halophilus]|uniref:phosphatidylglycerophosphatase C n=1 Tax=Sodalis endosymbiont of Henestaris halophilus TaxID=1929246 RepID=UPI000BBF48CF|nr:phosphatidylglycerophosphatase C [Sodalis endosymbiont of Henestaris halophilus]SNC58938.1 Phosphatidylglycerophosphatase C [Sodalis endosymbiont of Henestaris halophilus]